MRKIYAKYLIAAAVGLGLGGCASFSDISDVNTMQSATAQGGSAFTRALTDEYRALTAQEANEEAEWDDAGWFARRGLASAQGQVVIPADPQTLTSWHWKVPAPDRLAVLTTARGQLMSALDGGARDRSPAQAARAQAMYDCWAEEEAEVDIPTACEGEFRKAMSGLQVAVVPPVAAPAVQPMERTFQVFFDFDKSNITADAAKTIQLAAQRLRQGGVVRLDVTGHTDAAGPNDYNQRLSERRAAAVRAELVRDGVPDGEIHATGVGKAGQLVPTADGVREPQNRRAEIVLQR